MNAVDNRCELPDLSYANPVPTRTVLSPCPSNTLSLTHQYSRAKWKDEIEHEKQAALDKLKQTCHDSKRSQRKDEYPKICQNIEEKYQQHDFTIAAKVSLWEFSERCLNLLRTKGMVNLTEELRHQALCRFVQEIKVDAFSELKLSRSDHLGINQWFELTQPELVAIYGSPLYITATELVQADDSFYVQDILPSDEKVVGLNSEFWAGFIGGDKRLGHDLVFYTPEQAFFYYDLVAGSYL